MHTKECLNEDCFLTKFIENENNFIAQKQCLLNYMTTYFNNAIKKYPFNNLLRLYYIQFNFYNKSNLNSVKANLVQLKKMKNNIKEQFVIYCIEKEIFKIKKKDVNDGIESEQEALIIEDSYKRLKDYIINTTKLYVEFWGIFANNITNNLNNEKLYRLGEKLNIYLKEINDLWENNLKNKKIDIENENNAQLYSRFLRDIMGDKIKSEIN